jgi:hypothetical protein
MANAAHQSHTTSFLLEVEVKVLHHPSCCITFTKTAVEDIRLNIAWNIHRCGNYSLFGETRFLIFSQKENMPNCHPPLSSQLFACSQRPSAINPVLPGNLAEFFWRST